jgi:hypothetical protein
LHAPQLLLSDSEFVHIPLQQFGWVELHLFPQLPQFWLSVCQFVQLPLQQSGLVVVHLFPQLPQFEESVCVSLHPFEHAV